MEDAKTKIRRQKILYILAEKDQDYPDKDFMFEFIKDIIKYLDSQLIPSALISFAIKITMEKVIDNFTNQYASEESWQRLTHGCPSNVIYRHLQQYLSDSVPPSS